MIRKRIAIALAGLIWLSTAWGQSNIIGGGVWGDVKVTSAGVTFNPAFKNTNLTLSNGNLTAANNATGGFFSVGSTVSESSGLFYCEFTIGPSPTNSVVGIVNSSFAVSTAIFVGDDPNGIGFVSSGAVKINASTVSTIQTFTNGNVVSMAVDFTHQMIWFRTNAGNWNNSGTANPATNSGGISFSSVTGPNFPAVTPSAANQTITANFGATSYAESVPSGFGNW
jgi:hypothetical protein